jgi:hypothetical protein
LFRSTALIAVNDGFIPSVEGPDGLLVGDVGCDHDRPAAGIADGCAVASAASASARPVR